MSKAMTEESARKRQALGTSGTKNGNAGNAPQAPMKTQGSTSEGDASVASPGGAPGTATKETRSVKPKSRAAAMTANANSSSAAVPGSQPGDGRKTGSNGMSSPGATPVSVTKQGQRAGSATDASKRNKATGTSGNEVLKSSASAQQAKKQQ